MQHSSPISAAAVLRWRHFRLSVCLSLSLSPSLSLSLSLSLYLSLSLSLSLQAHLTHNRGSASALPIIEAAIEEKLCHFLRPRVHAVWTFGEMTQKVLPKIRLWREQTKRQHCYSPKSLRLESWTSHKKKEAKQDSLGGNKCIVFNTEWCGQDNFRNIKQRG